MNKSFLISFSVFLGATTFIVAYNFILDDFVHFEGLLAFVVMSIMTATIYYLNKDNKYLWPILGISQIIYGVIFNITVGVNTGRPFIDFYSGFPRYYILPFYVVAISIITILGFHYKLSNKEKIHKFIIGIYPVLFTVINGLFILVSVLVIPSV